MKALAAFDPLSVRAYFLLLLLTIAIALIGGGWWMLARVDPLLALPGLGWAVAAFVLLHPRPQASSASIAAAVLVFMLALLSTLLANRYPLVQLLVVGIFSWLLVYVAAWLWRALRERVTQGTKRRIVGSIFVVGLGLAVQLVGWPLVNVLYEPAATGDHPLAIDVVTSLPLHPHDSIGKQLAGNSLPEAPFLMALRHHMDVRLIDRPSETSGSSDRILLLAHPGALSPEQLVAIDTQVRSGGKVLILADGLLSWPPPFPLGDRRNPPVTSLLGPLLDHWGLRLDAPRGLRAKLEFDYDHGHKLAFFSPGQLIATGRQCHVTVNRHAADCRIGEGRAIVIADADLLNDQLWVPVRPRDGHGTEAGWLASNPHWLVARLDNLAGVTRRPALARPVWVR